MLHLIPPPLHRRLYRIADRLRRQWWKVRRPTRNSVVVVRHSYGPQVWALPGGGIDRGEDPATAAVREFREELGSPLSDVRELSHVMEPDSGSIDRLHVFVARVAGSPSADMREIVAAEFFDLGDLPSPADRRVTRWVREAAAHLQQR